MKECPMTNKEFKKISKKLGNVLHMQGLKYPYLWLPSQKPIVDKDGDGIPDQITNPTIDNALGLGSIGDLGSGDIGGSIASIGESKKVDSIENSLVLEKKKFEDKTTEEDIDLSNNLDNEDMKDASIEESYKFAMVNLSFGIKDLSTEDSTLLIYEIPEGFKVEIGDFVLVPIIENTKLDTFSIRLGVVYDRTNEEPDFNCRSIISDIENPEELNNLNENIFDFTYYAPNEVDKEIDAKSFDNEDTDYIEAEDEIKYSELNKDTEDESSLSNDMKRIIRDCLVSIKVNANSIGYDSLDTEIGDICYKELLNNHINLSDLDLGDFYDYIYQVIEEL